LVIVEVYEAPTGLFSLRDYRKTGGHDDKPLDLGGMFGEDGLGLGGAPPNRMMIEKG
jgi:hypothetical protein